MRPLLPLLIASALLSGCGGEGEPLSTETAARLQRDLDGVAAAVSSERCGAAQTQLERLERDAGNVDDAVDGDVRQTIQDGVDHLGELVDQECEEISSRREETTTTTTEPETTTSTTTTEPETTTTTTTTEPETTTTTTPEPAPTTPAPGPEDGDGGTGEGDQGDAGGGRAEAPGAGGAGPESDGGAGRAEAPAPNGGSPARGEQG